MTSFIYDKVYKYISVGVSMFFSCKKEFDRCFNRLDRPVEESRPDRQPDRFPSLIRCHPKWCHPERAEPALLATPLPLLMKLTY